MNEPKPSWIRRHPGAVLGSIVATVVFAAGYSVVSAVQSARTAASRSSDL